MGVAMFYHLTRSAPEAVLPMLIGRALGQGLRVAVRGRDPAAIERLDMRLWLEPEDGFLPHGIAGGPHEERQPVLLTTAETAPNGARCLVAVEGAEVSPGDCEAMEKTCILFDGNDPAAVEDARGLWRRLTEAGHRAQYWTEESGRWQMKSEK